MALTGLLGTQDAQPGALSLGVVDTPAAANPAGTSTLSASGTRLVLGSPSPVTTSTLGVSGIVVVQSPAALSARASSTSVGLGIEVVAELVAETSLLTVDATVLRRHGLGIILRDASGLLTPVP